MNQIKPSGVHGFLARGFIPVICLMLSATALQLSAQEQPQEQTPYPIKGMITINPKIFDFEISNGDLQMPVAGSTVVTEDAEGNQVVAKIHVQVGDDYIVLLPDGKLVGRKQKDVRASDKAFVASAHAEIAAAIIRDNQFKGFKFEETEHFVLVYNCSPDFARVTVRVMETMLDGLMDYATAQGIEVHEPLVPLPVIAFHTDRQFQQFKTMPAGVAAYYEMDSNQVILKEESALSRMGRPDLAEKESLSTIAHEGCHQLLHNIGVQQRLSRWPLWLGEGIAEFMAPTEPGRKFAWKGAGQINDLRMYELEIFLQKQFVKGFDGDTIDQIVRAGNLDSTGYSAAWTITHFLAKERKSDFDRYMRYLSRMAPLTGMVPEAINDETPKMYTKETFPKVEDNLVHFKAFFGDDLESLENEMVKFMRTDSRRKYVSPVAELPHIVGLAVVPGIDEDRKFACFFLNEGDVAEWASELKKTLSDYEQEHCQVYTKVFLNRGQANKAITDFLKSKGRTPR